MKILLSAYACEPNRGSEPGVGWQWAIGLATRGHQVWVLTRANNRAVIEAELARLNLPNPPEFVYYDLPRWLSWWKKGGRGVYFYYFLWQIGLYFVARKLCREIRFDRIHHVTFVNARQPSFLGYLGVPFVFGPVAGGESAPYALRKSYPVRGWLHDAWRDVLNCGVRLDPLMHWTFASADRIYATSEQTCRLVPGRYREKTTVQLAIALPDEVLDSLPVRPESAAASERTFKILYAGNLLYLKGIHLALEAFARLLEIHPEARLTIVGNGPDGGWLRKQAEKLGLNGVVEWISHLPQAQLKALYPQHDVFLFPSLHDSGGLVVLEAMAYGLPVVCLEIGGPGAIVDEDSGICLPVLKQTERDIMLGLRDALIRLQDDSVRSRLGEGARRRVQAFSWRAMAAGMDV